MNAWISHEDQISVETTRSPGEHLRGADRRCRAMPLPEGVLLRYTRSPALYFYLRSAVQEGKLVTQVYASESPYDRQKTVIGQVSTPMFEGQADAGQLCRVGDLIRAWVQFVGTDCEVDQDFLSLAVSERPN